jgi:hypothetical protein
LPLPKTKQAQRKKYHLRQHLAIKDKVDETRIVEIKMQKTKERQSPHIYLLSIKIGSKKCKS